MSNVVSQSEAKLHLRVTDDAEDDLIDLYILAAQDYIRNYLNSRIPGEDLSTPNIPSAIKAAALLLIGDLYDNRSAQTEVEVKQNRAVDSLLYPYRVEIGI